MQQEAGGADQAGDTADGEGQANQKDDNVVDAEFEEVKDDAEEAKNESKDKKEDS